MIMVSRAETVSIVHKPSCLYIQVLTGTSATLKEHLKSLHSSALWCVVPAPQRHGVREPIIVIPGEKSLSPRKSIDTETVLARGSVGSSEETVCLSEITQEAG